MKNNLILLFKYDMGLITILSFLCYLFICIRIMFNLTTDLEFAFAITMLFGFITWLSYDEILKSEELLKIKRVLKDEE